jgi:hypothetical protein
MPTKYIPHVRVLAFNPVHSSTTYGIVKNFVSAELSTIQLQEPDFILYKRKFIINEGVAQLATIYRSTMLWFETPVVTETETVRTVCTVINDNQLYRKWRTS